MAWHRVTPSLSASQQLGEEENTYTTLELFIFQHPVTTKDQHVTREIWQWAWLPRSNCAEMKVVRRQARREPANRYTTSGRHPPEQINPSNQVSPQEIGSQHRDSRWRHVTAIHPALHHQGVMEALQTLMPGSGIPGTVEHATRIKKYINYVLRREEKRTPTMRQENEGCVFIETATLARSWGGGSSPMTSISGSQRIIIMTPPCSQLAEAYWSMRLQHGMDAVISPHEAVLDLALPVLQ